MLRESRLWELYSRKIRIACMYIKVKSMQSQILFKTVVIIFEVVRLLAIYPGIKESPTPTTHSGYKANHERMNRIEEIRL